ncbi:MAG: TonB-dependent receptor plug domain-containing protein [Pyrinomonadaceae bacterium]|nr:TonB-dependent receptor plug domain-containing protein [Pyrinomonadaceae bacterium]
MKYFVSFMLLAIFAAAAFSQQSLSTVSGRAVSNTPYRSGVNRSGVSLTSVSDPSISFVTSADADGNFVFTDVPPGEYILAANGGISSISMGGERRITVAEGQDETVEITVMPDGMPIREYVTISADAGQPVDEVSKTVSVISGQELRERADITLAESLRSIPGFRVQQLGGFGRTASIKVRGLRNQDTAVLLDGVRLRDASSITGDASAFIGDLTLTSVSRVEVLRGSGSSLYGTNAIGGVVDLQSAEISRGPKGQVSYAAGGLGFQRFRGNITDAASNGLGFNLAVARTAYTDGIDGNDNAHNTNVQGRVRYLIGTNTSLNARAFVSDAYLRLNSGPDTFGSVPASNAGIIDAAEGVNFISDPDDPDSDQRSKFFNGQVSLAHSFGIAVVRAYYSGLDTERRNQNGTLGVGFQSASTSVFDGQIHTANATVDWSPNDIHAVKFGYEFEAERFGNDGFTPSGAGNFSTKASQSSNTVFVQDLISLFDGRLQFAGGARAQFFSLGDPRFSLSNAPYSNVALDDPPAAYTFDGAAAYTFRKSGTKIRAHAGNGYRVPSLYERFGTFYSSFGTPRFVALGDPGLKPERSVAFDAGIEQDLFGNKAKLSAVYFYTKLTDTIGFGNVVAPIGTTTRPFGGYINQEGGIARGGEFSIAAKPIRSADVFVSYTYTNSDQLVPQVTGSGVIATLGIPENQFTLVATQRFQRFWVNVDVLATSSYLAPIFSNSSFTTYVYRFDGNLRADATAGYTFKLNKERFDLRLWGTVENLTGNEYYENGFKTAGRNARAGISFGF